MVGSPKQNIFALILCTQASKRPIKAVQRQLEALQGIESRMAAIWRDYAAANHDAGQVESASVGLVGLVPL